MRTFLFLAVLAVVARAEAQTPADDEARMHFESGRAYYQRAQYDDAAREFGEAYRLSHRPALLLNASRALEGAGRFADAADDVQHYLDTAAPDDPDRVGAPERLQRLRASAERMRATHTVPPPPRRGPPSAASEAGPRRGPPPRSGLSDMQYAGIVTGSVSVGLGVIGLIVGLVADGVYQSLKLACPDGLCPASRQSDIDTGSTEAGASTLLFGFAVVGFCTGALLLIFGGDHPPPAQPHAVLGGLAWSF